eukprot:gene1963-2992_t
MGSSQSAAGGAGAGHAQARWAPPPRLPHKCADRLNTWRCCGALRATRFCPDCGRKNPIPCSEEFIAVGLPSPGPSGAPFDARPPGQGTGGAIQSLPSEVVVVPHTEVATAGDRCTAKGLEPAAPSRADAAALPRELLMSHGPGVPSMASAHCRICTQRTVNLPTFGVSPVPMPVCDQAGVAEAALEPIPHRT